jgi:quaternary ammonium compound-resistance protein SugE
MAWGILVLAGLLEIVWSVALKRADGFAHFWPSAIGIAVSLASLVLLTVALKTLPLATAYAVWVGIGAAGVAAAGIIFMGEPLAVPVPDRDRRGRPAGAGRLIGGARSRGCAGGPARTLRPGPEGSGRDRPAGDQGVLFRLRHALGYRSQ